MTSDAAARAIARLRMARDAVELAARPAGEIVSISRQAAEAIIDDLRAASRAVREMVE